MRNAFADEITALALNDSRIHLLSGDIGNRLFNKFQEKCPGRFFNCGVAEANMISVGAGMCLSGLRAVTYTITTFMTSRCFEQIKLDACYNGAPLIIVGVGAGLSYASLGPTHHSFEDVAILRSLPGMTVLAPCDAHELRAALRAAVAHNGPVYIRIGKKGEPLIHASVPGLEIGKGTVMRSGDRACIIATGTILYHALKAADILAERGIAVEVVNMPSIKPLDTALLSELFARHPLVLTVEESSVIGGFGGAVAEWASGQTGPRARLLIAGIPDHFIHEAGEQEYARERCGLTGPRLADRILSAL
jgi:transketolase